jgi:hypothetical protein
MVEGFNHKLLEYKDFQGSWDCFGYQILYKGKRIGGAESDRNAAPNRSNLKYYKGQSQIAIRDIVESGRCPDFMKQNIVDINNGSLDWLEK